MEVWCVLPGAGRDGGVRPVKAGATAFLPYEDPSRGSSTAAGSSSSSSPSSSSPSSSSHRPTDLSPFPPTLLSLPPSSTICFFSEKEHQLLQHPTLDGLD